jgi:hypothetical protein
MRAVNTLKIAIIMLVSSVIISAVMAHLHIPGFFLSIFLVPALTAAYYQRVHGLRFGKPERKRISLWYVAGSVGIGLIPLAMLVIETKDHLKEPLWQIVLALVIGVVVLGSMAYAMVFWVMGFDFRSKGARP